jgi:hypothetical protein
MRATVFIPFLTLAACDRAEAPRATDAPQDIASAVTGEPHRAGSADIERAVIVARALQARPSQADSVLAANAMTVDALEALMLRIASDSALSAEYARRVAGGAE